MEDYLCELQRAQGPECGEVLCPIDEHLENIVFLRCQVDAILKAEAEIRVIECSMRERALKELQGGIDVLMDHLLAYQVTLCEGLEELLLRCLGLVQQDGLVLLDLGDVAEQLEFFPAHCRL